MRRALSNRNYVFSQHGMACLGALGGGQQITHGKKQFVRCGGCKRGFAIAWANPGIDVGKADCNAVFAIFKDGGLPFLG